MRIAILTTGRQDYGIIRSTIHLLRKSEDFDVAVWVGGMHLSPRFGKSVELVRADDIQPDRELDFISEPPDAAADTARALAQVADALRADRPDALMLIGDRSETLAAGMAAVLVGVPIVHVHGGEESQGATDNLWRHALTKLSQLHLVSHADHAARVLQMGEDPSTVFVVGAPGLDNAFREDLPTKADIERELGHGLSDPLVIVTVQPAPIGTDPRSEVTAVAEAMAQVDATYLVTQPNADEGGTVIREFWRKWAHGRDNVVVVDALGEARYWSLLREARAVLGNSSSGIIEAPFLGVPVVNVGDRQKGRMRYGNVADVPVDSDRITRALRDALKAGRQKSPQARYMNGPAAPRIADVLRGWHPEKGQHKFFVSAAEPVVPGRRPANR
jgi:UDP-hydrolysing UDP-N-acetyl-D-glucosamine 2-epimerase